VDALDEVIRDVRPPPEVDTPGMQIEVPPWTESYDISATDVDGKREFFKKKFILSLLLLMIVGV
jgi:hypothetical protein